ncbi:MAG: hypothetical protein WBW88_11615 [Rhodothermales bacterium]|jgi:hypothetical protein
MKATITTTPGRTKRSYFFTLVLAACSMAACSSNPVDSNDGGDPGDSGAKTYNVVLDFKRVSVLGDCDSDLLGIKNEGEFQFQVGYSVQHTDGTWSNENVVKETSKFGKSDGAVEEKTDAGGVYTIDKKVTLTLDDGLNYRILLSAIEWDFPVMDSRMNGKTATEEDNTGGSTLDYSHKLDLGSSGSCKVRLYVDATQRLK